MKVLHVVERMGGGLADAMFSYARSASDFEHHLLYAPSKDASFDRDELRCFASVSEFAKGHFSRVRQVSLMSKRINADIIHGHSAFGGLYSRIAVSRRRRVLAYTPHSFPFERLDSAAPIRGLYFALERLLGHNTSVFVACSRREEQLARRISSRADVAYVVNVARVPPEFFEANTLTTEQAQERLLVVGAGRIMPQKGTSAFARIAKRVRADVPNAEFVWIGDGSDARLRNELSAAGVTVTGWLDRHEVLRLMSSAMLYVHTARWEGFPIVLLESIAVGTPISVLDRPYADGLPAEAVVAEDQAPRRIRDLLLSTSERAAALAATRRAFEANTASSQGRQLGAAYSTALHRHRR